jgi:lipoprotein NlpI
VCCLSAAACAQDVPKADELLRQARAAFEAGKTDEALKVAGQAIEADAKNPRPAAVRGMMHAALARHEEAVADFTAALKLDPQAADLYNRRGVEQFKLGRIKESIDDFDRFIALRPDQERSHWQRGISYYYAGRYKDGANQFAAYQTFDDNDVENAVWRYLCMARDVGAPQARQSLLKIKQDPRVPMMEVYALYKGDLKPEDVLAAARAGEPGPRELNSRLFYAHLYLGLYHEAAGDAKAALQHLSKAADEHKIGHYMWDVARVHAARLRKQP